MTDKTRPTITKAERRACFLEGAQDAEIFADAGLSIRKYAKGWFCVNEFHGMAWRNTVFHRTLARVLKENGYETSMHYQID